MERLDFCSFVVTLRRYIYADALGNQLDLLCLLFGSFLQSTDAEDFTFDNGQVCRWLNGTVRVSPKITSFYLAGENQEKLTQDMETKILTIMSDPAMAAQSECDLLMQDVSISNSKKKSLYAERDFSVSAQVAEFLSLLPLPLTRAEKGCTTIMTASPTTIPRKTASSTLKFCCRPKPRQRGKTGRPYGRRWNLPRKLRTAALLGN